MAIKQENRYIQCDLHQNFTIMGIKATNNTHVQIYKTSLHFLNMLKSVGSFPLFLAR